MLVQELAKAVDLVDYWVVALAVGLVKVFDLVKELVLVKVQELELHKVLELHRSSFLLERLLRCKPSCERAIGPGGLLA
jgi:hypothetical protein